MTTLKVLGNRDERLKEVDFGRELENFSVSEAVQFSTDRAASSYQVIEDLEKDDLVELIFEDDIHRWVTVGELERDFKYQLSRGGEAGVLEIPSRLPTGETSRGATTWALKALRVLNFDPVKKTAEEFAKFWDGRIMPKPGLYRFDQGFDKPSADIKLLKLKDRKPILLFIHGTFSSCAGGFGGFHAETWKSLQGEYGERIYGYDHKTLSLNPIENALDIVRRLPENAKLHLVTHSRGGLVGELLSRGGRKGKNAPFDEDDLKLMAENKKVAEALAELSSLLGRKKISVERFVRVACPARGTALAGGKLDRWLEVFINVIGKLLPPGASSTFGVLTDLLLDFKKQAADPEAMPGLASMVPESNFIKMINRPDVELDVDLSVVAGDIEKTDVIGRLAVFFTDLYYSDEHDLVVQTPAMYGGPIRREGRYFFHKGPGVHHSSYFSNKRTAEIVREALTVPTRQLGAKGFRPLEEAYVKAIPEMELVSRSYQKRSNLPQPVVYILPGIMGTHLSEDGNRIWLDILDMAMGKVANLRIDNRRIQPDALVGLAYANLVEYLSGTHEVIPFPYDWRLSLLDEAERFAKALEAKLDETKQPIRIVAHSMGGLLARAMIGQHPEIWEKITQRDGSRFVMLGTPNRGSYQIPRLILGQEKTFRMLALLDLRNSAEQLLEVISRFPGVLQLLPMDGSGTWNFLEAGTWDKFPNTGGRKWVKPQAEDLEQARQFHAFLEAGKKNIGDWNKVLYVAGYGQGAPIGLELDDSNNLQFQGTNRGDGTVPWETGILPELEKDRTYYMDAPHGDLANRKDYFPALFDLLNDGSTSRLLKTPPRFDRGAEDRYILRDEGVEIYPSQVDLETTVLGASPVRHQLPTTKPVRVSVVHGNLSFCDYPVAVGHYEGDGLYSAERALDYHLNGRLSARHALGLYPGAEGTAEVVLNDEGGKPGGAIIVGLDKAGELSPRRLTNSFANALREYGVKALEKGMVGEDGELTLASLLIGTGSTGFSVRNSVDAILAAVLEANRSFAQLGAGNQGDSRIRYNLRISEVQFVELFKDQAILAVKALEPFLDKKEDFAVNPLLQSTQGGWKRVAYEEPPGWWNRISIRAADDKDGSLIFSVPTNRARSEDSYQGVQRRNMDRLIAQAVKNPNWDQNLATAMFELLVPNRMKGSFRDMESVLFVLDGEAARYPWELLYDSRSGQEKPLVVQMGMIRQFSTFTFQERVLDVRNMDVMVIGNPAGTPADFANLPGAEQEARLVAAKLEGSGFQVQQAIHTDSSYIMSSLFSKDYRVLHLAGHGVFEYEYRETEEAEAEVFTGMVLGDGVFLTANEIRKKTNIPELVFINCCHLGKLTSDQKEVRTPSTAFNDLAASLSKELIEMGVKAVVAAGWAVDDSAALTFAEVFYEHLLKGDSFGEAVKAARVETYNLHHDRTNTWGAYQCYGDPAYRLMGGSGGERNRGEKFVDVEEAIAKVDQQAELAKTASAQSIERIRNTLQAQSEGFDRDYPEWMEDARLLEALGEAFGEAYWFEEAVRYYDKAIESGKSTAAIKAVEQSANFHVRLAVRKFSNDPSEYGKSKAEIETQIKRIEKLMETIGETPERWSVIGSGYKRLAQVTAERSQTACNSALKSMEAAYTRAWELKKVKEKKEDPYPLTNALTAALVQLLRSKEPDKSRINDLRNRVVEARSMAEKKRLAASDDFWARTGEAEAELVEQFHAYLDKGRKTFSKEVHDQLVGTYESAWRQYGSARQLNSIIEHYAFLVAVLGKNEKHASLRAELVRILNSLQTMFEGAD